MTCEETNNSQYIGMETRLTQNIEDGLYILCIHMYNNCSMDNFVLSSVQLVSWVYAVEYWSMNSTAKNIDIRIKHPLSTAYHPKVCFQDCGNLTQ